MKPWQLADHFQREHSTKTLEQVLGEHLSCGYIWSTPTVLMCARSADWDSETQELTINHEADHNAWFVELASCTDGSNFIGEFMRVAPYPRDWVCWCRRGEMRVRAFDWNKLFKKVRK